MPGVNGAGVAVRPAARFWAATKCVAATGVEPLGPVPAPREGDERARAIQGLLDLLRARGERLAELSFQSLAGGGRQTRCPPGLRARHRGVPWGDSKPSLRSSPRARGSSMTGASPDGRQIGRGGRRRGGRSRRRRRESRLPRYNFWNATAAKEARSWTIWTTT